MTPRDVELRASRRSAVGALVLAALAVAAAHESGSLLRSDRFAAAIALVLVGYGVAALLALGALVLAISAVSHRASAPPEG
jgi:hypothetical protein